MSGYIGITAVVVTLLGITIGGPLPGNWRQALYTKVGTVTGSNSAVTAEEMSSVTDCARGCLETNATCPGFAFRMIPPNIECMLATVAGDLPVADWEVYSEYIYSSYIFIIYNMMIHRLIALIIIHLYPVLVRRSE